MAIQGSVISCELGLYECIQCGRCTGGCPVSARSALNPRRMVYEALLGTRFIAKERNEIWECTTCATCGERCPKSLKPYELILALRSDVIEGGKVAPSIRDAMESTFVQGNPWGRARDRRSEWAAGEEIPEIETSTPLLYFVCCTAAYDPRIQNIARSIASVMKHCKSTFATLGNRESCCANEMREMGEEGLFEMLRECNKETFSSLSFNRLLTTSPHCFHTFKNDYEDIDAEIIHYTQLFNEYQEKDEIHYKGELSKRITYHDPCFLGKQNGIFDEPRYLLQNIPGVEYLEMDRSRERSVCCEGGGGRMWMESEAEGERLAELRVKDAVSMDAEILATACPFCLLTLEDAVKTTGNEDKIVIRDIAELIAELL